MLLTPESAELLLRAVTRGGGFCSCPLPCPALGGCAQHPARGAAAQTDARALSAAEGWGEVQSHPLRTVQRRLRAPRSPVAIPRRDDELPERAGAAAAAPRRRLPLTALGAAPPAAPLLSAAPAGAARAPRCRRCPRTCPQRFAARPTSPPGSAPFGSAELPAGGSRLQRVGGRQRRPRPAAPGSEIRPRPAARRRGAGLRAPPPARAAPRCQGSRVSWRRRSKSPRPERSAAPRGRGPHRSGAAAGGVLRGPVRGCHGRAEPLRAAPLHAALCPCVPLGRALFFSPFFFFFPFLF